MKLTKPRLMRIAMPLIMSTIMTLIMCAIHRPADETYLQFWFGIWHIGCPLAVLIVQFVQPMVSRTVDKAASSAGIDLT